MPIGVQVQMRDPRSIGNFMGKLVDVVLPRLRDFKGFSKHTASLGWHAAANKQLMRPSVITLKMQAESWQAYPEISQSYLKFPAANSPGGLQDYEIQFECWGV